MYKIDSAGKVTKAATAPVWLGVMYSTVTADPVTGDILVLSQKRAR